MPMLRPEVPAMASRASRHAPCGDRSNPKHGAEMEQDREVDRHQDDELSKAADRADAAARRDEGAERSGEDEETSPGQNSDILPQ